MTQLKHTLNHTHSPTATSWLASANGHPDFPIQNLPYAVFAERGQYPAWRAGVAIGNQVLDLAALQGKSLLAGLAKGALETANLASKTFGLNAFMATGPGSWSALRHALFALLSADATAATQAAVRSCLVPQAKAVCRVPSNIGDYTDFYTSIHHARNVGRIARPDDPLTPNFQWLPIAYHGRASSVVVSGTNFHRPMGQSLAPGAKAPVYGPCARMDFELELGLFIGQGNAMGESIPLARAEDHMFGICLLNDWSARDIQFWEMTPLGPFLGKSFCTSISPWIVTMEALAPFRLPFNRPADEPQPLAYLDEADNRAQGVLDIRLEVGIESAQARAQGRGAHCVSATSFRHQYWTYAQMVAQHTMGGCNLNPGDLLGSGTISGPTPSEAGAIIELTKGGKEPISLGQGETRSFLLDGDAVILRGWCERPGAARIGFGENRGVVLPALNA
ncbi:MAG: fumarylacetoacetase [Pseudomonadota bacterium]|jgi:fumarylacetoacetase